MQSNTTMLHGRRSSARKHARRPQHRRSAVRNARAAIAEAFRRMAKGVADKAAYARTVEFYRSSGHDWATQLG